MNTVTTRLPGWVLLCACLLYSGFTAAQSLEFERCQIKLNAVELDAECGRLLRPENPAEADGRNIELFVAKFPSRSPSPAADAFTIIQGGPGGSSIDMAIGFHRFLELILAKRDVLVVDQRGTGRSNPLACPPDENDSETLNFDPVRAAEYAKSCLAALSESDPRYYTTTVAVQDLDAVRKAAGYEQLTVYGTSYGTRVAQHYLRRFPEQTRAVILDGVVPVGLNLAGGEIARRSQEALDGMLERCRTTPACHGQFGDIGAKFSAVRERLTAAPVEVTLPHPLTGEITRETINQEHLFAVIRMMPYATEGLSLLPLIIADAYDGNYTALAAQVMMISESFEQGFAMGMQNSVMCAEDHPFVESADTENLEHTYFGTVMIDAINVACTHWPRGPMDDDFRVPFDSEKPVLILSGETDPITPPANGEQALAMFSNAKHIVVPAHGHGVIARGCLPPLIRDFVETIDLQNINTQCVDRERAMPFFVDRTGPKP